LALDERNQIADDVARFIRLVRFWAIALSSLPKPKIFGGKIAWLV
jgi:hypothetical protein